MSNSIAHPHNLSIGTDLLMDLFVFPPSLPSSLSLWSFRHVCVWMCSTPKGLEDVSTYPTLFAELLGDGWTEVELRKLAGENFLRVLREVEAVRDKQKQLGVKPFEEIPNFRTEDPYNCTSS